MAGEWREKTIAEVATVVGGGTPSTNDPENFNGDIPWLTPKDLSGYPFRYISRGERNISQRGYDSSNAQFVPKGSVLLTTRAPVGYVAIASNPLTTNQGFHSLVLNDEFHPEFVYYLLKNKTDYLRAHATGTTYGELSGSALKRLTFFFPPLPEQRAIAHILGVLDDKIELNRRMNETLEAMARALFKSWFIDFDPVRSKMNGRLPAPSEARQAGWRKGESLPLSAVPGTAQAGGLPAHLYDLFPDSFVDSELGEIPKGWEVGTIGDIAEVSSGKRPPVRYTEKSADVSIPLWGGNGPMAFVPEPLVTHPILLTGRVGTLGSVFRITTPCWPSDNTLIMRTKEMSMFEYLFFNLKQIDFSSLNRGSTQPLLTQTDLVSQPLLLPSVKILERFHSVTKNLFIRVDQVSDESRTLAALRDTLLPKLISGELRVKEAEKFLKERGL